MGLPYLDRTLGEIFAAPKKKRADPYRRARAQAKRLAAECGATIEVLPASEWAGRAYNVWPPAGAADPFEGDHYCLDWEEVLDKVRAYAKP